MPSLDDVTQTFEADVGPYVAELQAAIEQTEKFAKAVADAGDGALVFGADAKIAAAMLESLQNAETMLMGVSELLSGSLNELRDVLGTLDAQETLAAASAQTLNDILSQLKEQSDDLAMIQRLLAEQLGASTKAMAAQAAMAQLLKDSLDSASKTAGTAGVGFGLLGGIIGRTGVTMGTLVHWVVAGGSEFLAVFIPAMVAAGAAATVMVQGADDAWQRFEAMFTTQEAISNYIGTTTGQMVGLKSVLQQAQDAADPRVFELVGAGISIMAKNAGSFVTEGTQVLNVLDNWSAKLTAELTGGFGQQLQGLLSGGTKDLAEFGEVLGNLGHALLNLAGDMPGLAHVLLALLAGFTDLLKVVTTMPGIIITVAMAFEEFWRWGGLAATIIGSVLRWVSLIPAAFGAATLAIANTAKALIVATVSGFAGIIETIGKGMVALGGWIAELGLASIAEGETGAAAVGMGAAISAAGARMVAFAGEVRMSLIEMGPFMAVIGLAGAVLLAFAVDKVLTAKTAMQEFTQSLQDAVEKSSGLNEFAVIANNFSQLGKAEVSVADGAFAAKAAMSGAYDAGLKYGNVIQATKSATDALSASQKQQQQDLDNITGAVGFLSKTYGVSLVGAMAIAGEAGVNLANGITGTGNAAEINRIKIANYMAGMQMMGQSATVAGHDVTMLGIQSQLASTKVSQLNSAVDEFVTNMSGGTSNLGGLVESIANIGKVTVPAGQSLKDYNTTAGLSLQGVQDQLTNFSQVGSQVWQNFDSALSGSGEQLADWFRTAGAEGAIGSQQFSQAMLDITAQFVPMAAKSKNAQEELVGFAQAQGLNITSFPQLQALIKSTGAGMSSLTNLVGVGTKGMADMNSVAQALASTVGTDVVAAMNNAKIAASQLGQNTENLASAWDSEHTINQQVISGFQATYGSLMDIYHNSGEAQGAIDALARSMGMTNSQVNTLNSYLKTASSALSNMPKNIKINFQFTTSGATNLVGMLGGASTSGGSYNYTATAGIGGSYGRFHGGVIGYASGGIAGGPAGADRVPAWLTMGEGILTNAAVSALGGPLAIRSLNDAPARAAYGGGGAGGATALGLNLVIQNKMSGQTVNTTQRQATLVYNRRNPSNNLGLRTR